MKLYPEDAGVMGAQWHDHTVVCCDFCRRYAMGRRACFLKRYGIGAGVWVTSACYSCRDARVWR